MVVSLAPQINSDYSSSCIRPRVATFAVASAPSTALDATLVVRSTIPDPVFAARFAVDDATDTVALAVAEAILVKPPAIPPNIDVFSGLTGSGGF